MALLVKMLHPISEIAASLSSASEQRVRLSRDTEATAAPNSATKTPSGERQVSDPAAAVVEALADPLDYPPLADSIVPGDRVAIAIDEAVPQLPKVLRGAFKAVQRSGVDPEAIAIVTTDAQTSQICHEALAQHTPALPQFVVHDPNDEANLCMVGMTKRKEPLRVNRTIFDADVVLPIGCARPDNRGAYDSLFPRFSDAEAIKRFRAPTNWRPTAGVAEKKPAADKAGWLIGVAMTVQVVPGENETVANVVAGEPQAVARRSKALSRARWLVHSPHRVGLVVATITGGPASQTWANVGRALAAAEPLLEVGGAVAICCNLDVPPGESLGRSIGSTDLEKTEREILKDQNADSWPALQLVRALQRGTIYFLSQLDAETVEDMGLAPIADVNELARLVARHESFAVLEDAQHAVATVEEDDHE